MQVTNDNIVTVVTFIFYAISNFNPCLMFSQNEKLLIKVCNLEKNVIIKICASFGKYMGGVVHLVVELVQIEIHVY